MSAANVVLSWPQRDGDADLSPARWSRRGPSRPAGRAPALQCTIPAPELVRPAPVLIAVRDDRAPRVDEAMRSAARKILELQSRCPFRALGAVRLAQRAAARASCSAWSREERGIPLHRVLEELWVELA